MKTHNNKIFLFGLGIILLACLYPTKTNAQKKIDSHMLQQYTLLNPEDVEGSINNINLKETKVYYYIQNNRIKILINIEENKYLLLGFKYSKKQKNIKSALSYYYLSSFIFYPHYNNKKSKKVKGEGIYELNGNTAKITWKSPSTKYIQTGKGSSWFTLQITKLFTIDIKINNINL